MTSRHPGSDLGPPRWRGQPGRLEVWYATATDRRTGNGLWLHHEVVAPVEGSAYAHGWVALFPSAAAPRLERFGPGPPEPGRGKAWFATGDVAVGPQTMRGHAGDVGWELEWRDGSPPLWTFPRWAWERELLPAAQVALAPRATLRGRVAGEPFDGTGAVARIYGHGNAQRWAWLHAELGDRGVIEVVSAVSRRRALSRLPPLAFVRVRLDGEDWPFDPLPAAPLLRSRLDLPTWSVRGVFGRRRLDVRVTLPAEGRVALGYTDPDGATATCHNSERADADVRLWRWSGGWRLEGEWLLRGRAHAEVGMRP